MKDMMDMQQFAMLNQQQAMADQQQAHIWEMKVLHETKADRQPTVDVDTGEDGIQDHQNVSKTLPESTPKQSVK